MRSPGQRAARFGGWTAAAGLAAALALSAVPALALPEGESEREVSPQRWMRGVCRGVLTWQEDTGDADGDWLEITDELGTDDITPKQARRRLIAVADDGVSATTRLIEKVQDGAIPRVADGRRVARDYVATLKDYRVAYRDSQRAYESEQPGPGLADATAEIDDQLLDDIFEIAYDPLEELRNVPELAEAIDTQAECAELTAYVASVYSVGVPVGNCVNGLDTELPPVAVDCAAPHEGEVYFVDDYPSDPGAGYPGAILDIDVENACLAGFAAYVGLEYDLSRFEFTTYAPVPESWAAGHREVVCVVFDPAGDLTGSVAGTAQ